MALAILIIGIALFFDFLNGFHDSANSIATVVSTRVMKPHQAVMMAAFANFIGAFVFTTAVAATIAKGIVTPSGITLTTILAGLLGACLWNIITWYLGLPTSSSHALIGGMIGAVIVKAGTGALVMDGIIKTFTFILIAPLLGVFGGIVFTIILLLIIRGRSSKSISGLFKKMQIGSSFLYSLSHGTNDAQKTMGIIALTLIASGYISKSSEIPIWVILSSHAAIALGTYLGGWKIVKTMGTKLIHLRPFEGFCAETASAVTLFTTAAMGIPVSTTHVIAGGIIGVGTVENAKKVKWITTRKIFMAWVVTIPVSILFGMIFSLIIK
ncbi:MAG: inorganic phosphate transporter [bacterium]